jgi:hypothetical protein
MKKFLFAMVFVAYCGLLLSQRNNADTCSFFNPCPKNYEVKKAIEIESLFPMFLYGGYHFAACYRHKHFRIRLSVINGGTYNAETAGVNNNVADYNRFYSKTGAGVFVGYNIWKNLEIYTYLERHHFRIEEKNIKESQMINSTDFGLAASYQIFIGRIFYLQPGIHFYFRRPQSLEFSNQNKYTIPTTDISPVIRAGLRIYRSYK